VIMFVLLTFVYVGAVTVLVGVMPWQAAGVRQSPFVTVFEVAGIPSASTLMNVVVLTAALSGANASLYVAARMLFSLSRGGYAPPALGRLTAAGSPRNASPVSGDGDAASGCAQRLAPEGAYLYIIGASLFGGMIAWWVRSPRTCGSDRASRRRTSRVCRSGRRAARGVARGIIALTVAIASTWWVEQSRITISQRRAVSARADGRVLACGRAKADRPRTR